MCALSRRLEQKIQRIRSSKFSIYDLLDGYPELFLDIAELQEALDTSLRGLKLGNLPVRTRSKVFKTKVCEALGYSAPERFRRERPRFPGQDFDVYVQKANNLQVWNESVAPTRRYVIARPDVQGVIRKVRVITGEALAKLDKTGTLTKKYQARRKSGKTGSRLVTNADTPNLVREFGINGTITETVLRETSPIDRPFPGSVLPIRVIYERLVKLVGTTILDPGLDQERNRGIEVQKRVCDALQLKRYADKGQWPDILSQALEIKLQTASTIDLGLVLPNSDAPAQEVGSKVRHCDVRYAVFYARRTGNSLEIQEVVVSSGERFFEEFNRFEGRVVNQKLQIRLGNEFFD